MSDALPDIHIEPRYGAINLPYVSTWSARADDQPMWALNLMKYRDLADYADGRETTLTGQEADDLYAPFGPLSEVGAQIVLVAPVSDQLVGDDTTWDRIAIVQYPSRDAMARMQVLPSFQELHVHKEAGMASTIVAATFPQAGSDRSAVAGTRGSVLLLDLVADAAQAELEMAGAVLFARFDVEGVIIGDDRTWSVVRWYYLDPADLADVRSAVRDSGPTTDRYVIAMQPMIDTMAAAW